MNNILLISEDVLKTYSNLNDNTFGKWILPAIREAQEMGLMPIIGECLYNKICELVADGSISDILFTQYKDLLDDKIQPYLIYKTLSNIIPILNGKMANMGSVLTNDEHIVNLSQGEADLLKTYYSERCDFYTKRLQDFIKNNASSFPEITCSCGNMQPNLDSSENSVGLWLGGSRGKRVGGDSCSCSSSSTVTCADYQSGFTDGVEFQKRKLEITGFTENGRYISENGYKEVSINVAQTGATLQGISITDNGDYTPEIGYDGFSAVSVNVPHTGHTDEEMEAQYQSGYTSGETHQKSLLSSTAITDNGTYINENGFSSITVNVPQSGGTYDGYNEGIIDGENADQPLTFKIESDGEIKWRAHSNQAVRTISYSKNGGEWINVISTTGDAPSISVVSGDVIRLKGNNSNYCEGMFGESSFSGSCSFEICGNIMSLIYGDDFKGQTVLPSAHTFCYMFSHCPNVTTIRHLIMPATVLTESCYTSMFSGCRNINYVKCFATDISANLCTSNWLGNVSSTGTFVKKADVEWQSGDNGIPENWVVQTV